LCICKSDIKVQSTSRGLAVSRVGSRSSRSASESPLWLDIVLGRWFNSRGVWEWKPFVPSEVCQSFIGGGIPIGTPRQGEWIRKVAYHFGYGIGFRESMEPSFHFYGEYPLPILTLRAPPEPTSRPGFQALGWRGLGYDNDLHANGLGVSCQDPSHFLHYSDGL
jgi:hypothetical protein